MKLTSNSGILSIFVQVGISGITYFVMLIILKDKMKFEGIEIIKNKL